MNNRGLTIAALVLAALLALKKKGGDQVVLTRDSNGKWQITTPKIAAGDQSAVSDMLATLSSLNSERLVEEKAANLGQYGLITPTLEAEITDKSNTVHKILLGDDTPTGNAAYLKLDTDSRVFTIATYTKTSISKGFDDLRDKRLITAEADKISRLELIVKQEDIEFGRDKDQWQILKPKPLRADGSQVDELIRKLTEAKMDVGTTTDTAKANSEITTDAAKASSPATITDVTKASSAFSSGTPIATAKITTDAGTQQIEVRKNKEDYYAKSSVADGIYKVSSELGQALDKKLADFRNKKLFDFGMTGPQKLEVHDGSKAYFLTKGGDDWWSADSKKVETNSAETLVNKLRDLQANNFEDSGFGAVAMEIIATSNDSKRVEKILISKSDKGSIAKREGEQALYVLDAQTIQDLQKLLSDLKPEPPGTK